MVGFAFRNIGLKLLSICIAFLLWLGVAGERVVERVLRVPLEFQHVPPALEIVGGAPDSVDVRVRGSSGALASLGPGEMAALVDLRGARPGQRLFHLTPANVTAPYGVEVLQVSPSTLSLSFENAGVRVVPIRPMIEGEPAAGYEVVGVAVEPPTVDVAGPESVLASLPEAITEPVVVQNRAAPVREVVTVGVADSRLRLRAPQRATVTVTIAPVSTEREFMGVPIALRNLGDGLAGRVEPPAGRVTLRGPQPVLRALASSEIDLFVDAAGLTAGSYTLPVLATAPAGAGVAGLTPATVRVRLVRRR